MIIFLEMPIKLLFTVSFFLYIVFVGTLPARDFKIGDYNAYAIIGDAKLIESAEYASFTGDFGFRGKLPRDNEIDDHLAYESGLLGNFQLNVINLEFMLSGMSGREIDNQTDRAMIKILKGTGYDLISLANNHALDYGSEGIEYNSIQMEKSGLSIIGTRESAAFYWETGGHRIAIYSLADYIDKPDNERLILRVEDDLSLLAGTGSESYFRIAFVHLGSMSSFVSPHEHEQVKRLLEAGIDLVVCTGSHFIKGIVTSGGKPVAYGIGNHLFSYAGDDTEPIGMHLVAGFVSGKFAQLFVVPFYNSIWEGKSGPLTASDFELFKKILKERSAEDPKLYFSDPRNLNNLKDQFGRFGLDRLKDIKFRHLKYAAGIALYNYPVITVAGSMAMVTTIGYFGLWIYSRRQQRRQ